MLIQGGLEIPYRDKIYMSPTIKNKQLTDIYRNSVELFYYEIETSNTVESFIARKEKTSSRS